MATETTIILIDDDPAILDLIELYLDDYDIIKIENITELEKTLKEEASYHLFISDIELGGDDSSKAFSMIKEYNSLSTIIGISGHSSFQKQQEVLKKGYDDFFVKPINFKALKEVIEFHIEKNHRWLKIA
jgi:DNA-binding NtrC family response regulator